MRLRPFFNYYGSKWRLAPHYAMPAYDTIIEPFAGAAGYATLHHTKNVTLYDASEEVCAVWRFLIDATPEMILKMPLIKPGQKVDDLDCSQEERTLISFWLGKANHSPRQTLSPFGIERYKIGPDAWGEKCRRRVSSQVGLIKHWRVECTSYADIDTDRKGTWFIDPPYEKKGRHYPKGSNAIDFSHLRKWCESLRGQVIVCEHAGATWLDFTPLPGVQNQSSRKEVIWQNKMFHPETGDLFEVGK